MPIVYNKLFSLLKDRKLSIYKLKTDKVIGTATIDKIRKGDGHIDTRSIERICKYLQCQPGDIMSYVPDKESPVAPVVREESAFVKAMAQMDKRLAEDHERMLLAFTNNKGVEVIGQPKKAHPFEMMLQNERTANAIKPVCLAQEEASEDAAAEDVPDVKQEEAAEAVQPVEAAAGHVDRSQGEAVAILETPSAVEDASVESVAEVPAAVEAEGQ